LPGAGGFAAIDHRVDSRFPIGPGYMSGSQWSTVNGRGTSDSYQTSVYASFTEAAFT
jgi:hypothetical protein